MEQNKTSEIFALLIDRVPAGLEMPPKVFVDMQGEFLNFTDEKTLMARFPVLERYQNPLGYMQGGVLVAIVDNTIGPLSYLVAPPSVTTQLNTSYVRPVTPQDEFLYVTAWVSEQTRRQLFLTAHVTNDAEKMVAISHASCTILDNSNG